MRSLMVVTTIAALAVPAMPALAQRGTAGYAVRATTMRAGPDYDYPAVRRVARNVRVDVYGCLRDRSWCDAGYRSDRGWIPGRDLVVDYRGRRSAVSSYPGISVLSFIFGSYWDSHYRDRSFYTERPRWEQQYYNNFQPRWGSRPQTPPAFQRPNRQPEQPVRLQLQPRPRAVEGTHPTVPTQITPLQPLRRPAPGVAPGRVDQPPPKARRVDPTPQPAPAEQHGGRKGKREQHP